MENNGMKQCPYCAESIKAEAIKCRYCGSSLTDKKINLDFLKTPGYWHRVDEGKKVAGVCTGLASQFDSPIIIMPLRLFFILTTIFYGFGIILYILLWVLMPSPVDSAKTVNVNVTVKPEAPVSEQEEEPEKKVTADDGSYEIVEENESGNTDETEVKTEEKGSK